MSGYGDILKTVGAVLAWYFWSSAILFTNRHLLTSGLTAPITLTLLHMLGSSIFSNGAVSFCGFERQTLQSQKQLYKVLALSFTFGLSVVCGTYGLKFIPVSFNEVIASTTPLFAALFSFLAFREMQGTYKTVALLLIALGCMTASKGEPMWSLIGFSLSLTATATRALRTVLGELLMASDTEKLDSMNLLRYMSSFVVVMLIPVVLFMEGAGKLVDVISTQMEEGNTMFVFWFFFNIFAAFCVNLCQLMVTKYVGSVALQVLGIFKGVCSSILSVFIFQNPVTASSAGGYAITVAGVATYTYFRHQERLTKNQKKIVDIAGEKSALLPKGHA
eukprot:scaffold37817_cov48-Prasinocladus_malaysianus.AAC.2